MQKEITISKWISISKFFLNSGRNFEISILMILTFGLFSNSASAQLSLEDFNSGIPASWAITSNLTVTSNWGPTTATGGYQSTPGAVVNPSLNSTVGQTAEYYLISPQFNTPPPASEIRFFTKQGSFTNRGTVYQLRLSTADQPDIDSFNVILASWTEAQLNVSATIYEEKIVTIPSLPQGLPVYIAFVAVTNQDGTTATSGDSWFVDNIRVITSCAPVTGINSTMSANGGLINWSHATANNFEIQIVPQGSGIAASGTPVTGLSYNATGLTDGTTYDVYIKTICDATTASTWAGPFQVTTTRLGLTCATPLVIPSDISAAPYVLSSNLALFHDTQTYTPLNSQGLSCQPVSSLSNWLNGDHAFLAYTPATSGLVNVSMAVNATGTNNCWNSYSSVFIFDSCTGIGTTANCLGSIITGEPSGNTFGQLQNVYLTGGQTYYFVISSPYVYNTPGAGICFTFTLSAPTCPIPSGVTYENLLQTSATFSWENPLSLVSAWEYIAKPAALGAPIASDVLTPTSTNSNNIVSGLIPNTSYNFYVRSVCSGTPGPWSNPKPFKTLCNVYPTPYTTAFTGATPSDPEPCWTALDLNNDGRAFTYSNDPSPGAPQGQIARLFTSASGSNTNDMLVSPQINLDGVTQKRLRFKFKGFGGYTNSTGYVLGESTFMIKVSSTGVGPNNFNTVILPLQTYETGNNWIETIVPIPLGITGDINFAWYLPPGHPNTATNFYVDDVFVEDLPACSDPIYPGITAGSITQTSAEFYWTNGYNNSQWEIVVQPLGSGIPSVTGDIVNTNPYTKTGLTPSTRYEFYIRTYCSATLQGNWIGPFPFNTLCDAQPVPYFESLNDNDVNTKKFCWSTINRNGDANSAWVIESTQASIRGRNLFMNPFVSFDDWLVTGQINVVGQKMLKFKYRAASDLFNPSARGNFEVVMSTTPDFSTYTVLIPSRDFTNSDYQEDFVIFNGIGPAYFAFHVPPTMDNPTNSGIIMIDDFSIEDAPLCPFPSNISVSNITPNTAILTWLPGFAETQWEVVVQAPYDGTPTGSGTIVNTTPTYNATGLTQGTEYEFYVRSVCGADYSAWVGPFRFRTSCNALPTPFLETFDSNSTTESCWTVVNANENAHFWQMNQPADPIFGDQMAALFSGSNGNNDDWLISPTIMAQPNQRLRFYYKTNSSFFEEDLKVKISTNGTDISQFATILYENNYATTLNATGTVIGSNTITVTDPQGVRVGDRVYIPGFPIPYATTVTNIAGNTITMSETATASGNASSHVEFIHEVINNTEPREMIIELTGITVPTNINIAFYVPPYPANPWNYRGQFLFIDNVIVENIPACSEVINVTTSNLIDTGVTVNWETVGTATSWEISVQPQGTAAPVGNTLPQYLYTATAHPFNVTGLTPSTAYEFYVRAICSNGQSQWVGPFEITTQCDLTNICQYTITLDNGTTGRVTERINLNQNGQIVQSMTFPGSTTPTDYQVYLCRGVEFSLYWQGFGNGTQYSDAQITIRDYLGTIVWTSPRGLGTINSTIYSGVSSCGTVTCPQPTNLAVNNQGVLSWTAGGSETQWEVFIQPLANGTIPQSGIIVNTNSYTPQASDFPDANSGTVEFLVRAVCSATDKSYWSGPKVFIRNDEPNNALRLQVNSSEACVSRGTNASFIGSTISSVPTSCDGVNGGDIWFEFVAASKVHVVELSNFNPGSYYTAGFQGAWPKVMMSLYEVQTDGSLVETLCSNNNSLVAIYSSELTIGNTYKIRIKLDDTIAVDKRFDICVSTPSDICNMNAFNFSFEKLPMQNVTGVSTIINARVVPGWRVNTDWETMFFQEGNNGPGVRPFEGGQCLQLTHDNASTWDPTSPNIKGLYKDFDTSEITHMDYSFASATRTNGSTLELWAGPPSGPFTQVTEHTSNTLVWALIEGTYNVPAGQNTTRFIFRTREYVIGHLLDAANFKANNKIKISSQALSLTCDITSATVEAYGIGEWIADQNNPAVTIIADATNPTTTISGFNTPGVYTYYWKSRYCEEMMTITYQGFNEVATTTSPVEYCMSDTASALTATAPSGYTLEWYTEPVGGTGDANAPTPSTTTAGTTTYYVALVNAGGCAGPRTAIDVVVNELVTPVVDFTYNNTAFCTSEANPVLTPASGFTTGGTYSATPAGLTIDSATGAINLATSLPGSYEITYDLPRVDCTLAGSSSYTIEVSQAVTYDVVSECESQVMFLNVNATGGSDLTGVDYTWQDANGNTIGSNSSTFNVNDYLALNSSVSLPTTISVTVTNGGCELTKSYSLVANECSLIPRGISPNGDGDNDAFDLTGLGAKQVSIFNRYGTEVYSYSGNYTNQWNGNDKDGSNLPDGTYFYNITFQDGKSVTGWVYIIRQY
jgi:large repetitive protein